MKTPRLFMQVLSLLALAFVASLAAADTSSDLESLGSNQQVSERAAKLESRTRVSIVQGRAVDRNWRLELGTNYGPVAFGDSYLNTQNLGANVDLHINPRLSVGVHYAKAFNQLTADGQNLFNQARTSAATTGDYTRPQISYQDQQVMGVIDWYMTYGKLNFFDLRTIQFDIYSTAGYGQVKVGTDFGGLVWGLACG
jgi:outer membrane beta-barrel protein